VQELADAVIGKAVGAAVRARLSCRVGWQSAVHFRPALRQPAPSLSGRGRRRRGLCLGNAHSSWIARRVVLREVVTATAVIGDDATPGLISEAIRIDVTRVMWSLRALTSRESGWLPVPARRRPRTDVELDGQLGPGSGCTAAPSTISGRPGGREGDEHHLVAIRTLCEESLRPVLERSDLQGVDSSAVELALRCLRLRRVCESR